MTCPEAFWRLQFAQNFVITPGVQYLIDPVGNPDDVWIAHAPGFLMPPPIFFVGLTFRPQTPSFGADICIESILPECLNVYNN